MYELKISPEAKNDLAEIKKYISEELSSPQAAKGLVAKIMKRIRTLAEYPELGASLSTIIDMQTDYRFLVCANHLIFYKLENYTVFISRVLYAKRDYLRVLFGSVPVEDERQD
ncbi:type II toxin-antitoxin system RelE/ParE family toxin [Dethiobacter alkaliphilus]|uniref:Addiction module toxin, RelE/StbE family n=1 Tax=Dethiobacter alkaliphilus AHT 1 TaxID=555088 RepID=C0GCG9_DETAL|nr:type II toxin-antitoxin system RelE/ParE family toxin [Dethiobacter alkaliphilus]EEG78904.1 addiction module toxin, RelE/StbE family [Dethiobacter alkaliphilus AHT 1]